MEIAGCGSYTIEAVNDWLKLGGRRLDAADSYDTQYSVGVAMAASGVPRSEIFLLQKTGNWNRSFHSIRAPHTACTSNRQPPAPRSLLNQSYGLQ